MTPSTTRRSTACRRRSWRVRARAGRVLVGLNRDDPRLHDVTGSALDRRAHEEVATGLRQMARRPTLWSAVRPSDEDGGEELLMRDGTTGTSSSTSSPTTTSSTSRTRSASRDRRALFSWCRAEGSDTARLVAIDTRPVRPRSLRRTIATTSYIMALSRSCFHPKTHEPQLVPVIRERHEYIVLDATIRRTSTTSAQDAHGDAWLMGRDLADERWIVLDVRDNGPPRYSHLRARQRRSSRRSSRTSPRCRSTRSRTSSRSASRRATA